MTKADAEVLHVLCLVRCPLDAANLDAALGRDISAALAHVGEPLRRLEAAGMVQSSPSDKGPVVFSASPKGYAAWIAMSATAAPQ